MSLNARITDIDVSYGELIDHIKATNRDESHQISTEYVNNHHSLFSPRTKSKIQDLPRLIRELETREYLTVTNVASLDDIVRDLNNPMVTSLFTRHQRILEQSREDQNALPAPAANRNAPPANQNGTLPSEVRTCIQDNIGRKWSKLAHELGMIDARVDELDIDYKECWRKVSALLTWFEQRTPTADQNWKLTKALRRSQRKDLAEDVEDIFRQQMKKNSFQ